MTDAPALPPGFTLDAPELPPLPPGFALEQPAAEPITAGGLIGAALDIPVLGPLARKAEAATYAGLGPSEKLPEPTFSERYQHHLKTLEQPLETFREQHPIASALANLGGTAVATGGLGATAAGAKLLGMAPPGASLWGQAVRGALSGGTISAADAALRGEDVGMPAVAGGALGAAAPVAATAIRRAITPLPAAPAHAAEVSVLRSEGVPMTAGAVTGSKPLQWAESALGDVPFAGRGASAAAERQAEGFTSAALRRAGITAARATPDTIDAAFNRIGNEFETVGRRNVMQYDAALGNDLATVKNEYSNLVQPVYQAPIVQNLIQDIQAAIIKNGGHLTGQEYNTLTSQIARSARKAIADPYLQDALHGIRDSLDEAFARTLTRTGNVADLARLQQARRQYRNMLVIERAATGPGSETAKGLLSPSQLRNAAVALQGRRAFARGQGDFADLTRAGEAVLKPLPQSGTAPRAYAMAVPHTIGAIGLGMGEPVSAIAGLAGPALTGRLLMSRPMQAYLGNQALAGGAGPGFGRALLGVPSYGGGLYFPSGP